MKENNQKPTAAVFVDMSNIFFGAKNYARWRISYEKIREYLKTKYNIVFLRLYGCEDITPSTPEFRIKAAKQQGFYARLTKSGFDIFKKPLQYVNGKTLGDVDNEIKEGINGFIAINEVEYIVLFSGDNHFLKTIKECNNLGKRTDIYSFRQTLSSKIKKYVLENPKRANVIYLNKKRAELEFKQA